MTDRPFRLGRLDHVHLRVPDRAEAAAWYGEHLGFEPVDELRFWAEGFEGGPLQLSADGGHTTLALFEASDGHPMLPLTQGVAFSVELDGFVAFARSLPGAIPNRAGTPLQPGELIDFDLCFAYEFADPWGNAFELNCYDHAGVRSVLVDGDGLVSGGLVPDRKWPVELYDDWRA